MQLGSIFGNKPNNNLIQKFAEFKKSMEGKDAEKIVKEMLSDGRMTKEQFESFKSQAQSLISILR